MALNKYYNPETFQYQNEKYTPPESGRALEDSLNSAQQQMGANVISTGANIAATGIGMGFQSSEINKAQSESKRLAEQTRSDTLKQQNINVGLKKQLQEQDVKRFELNKLQENETLRHSTWLADFKKALENDAKLHEIADNLFTKANKSEQIKSVILNSFRRKK